MPDNTNTTTQNNSPSPPVNPPAPATPTPNAIASSSSGPVQSHNAPGGTPQPQPVNPPGSTSPKKLSLRHSKEAPPLPPPLPTPPPPPTEAIPLGLGPDGKSLLPKLNEKGEPLKGPPLDKAGNPLPPPPIIGPGGKELPRPKDSNGRPLPIYVSADGKPVLDKDGNPIPLRFNKEGKPIPLDIEYPSESPSKTELAGHPGGDAPPTVGTSQSDKKDKIPDCIFYGGIVDIVASLIVTIIVAYFMYTEHEENRDGDLWKFLAGSFAAAGVGAACGAFPIVAAKKNQFGLVWMWFAASACLLLIQVCLMIFAPKMTNDGAIDVGNVIHTAFCGVRCVFTLGTIVCSSANNSDDSQGQGQVQHQQYTETGSPYPRENTEYYHAYPKQPQHQQYQQQALAPQQSQMIVQQQPSWVMQQPVMVSQPILSVGYSYPYGYGYPTNYGYSGFGMGYGYGAGMGMWGGSWGGCHHGYCPYYDYGWGW